MEFNNRVVLSIVHLLLVVPLFLYVGFTRANTPNWLYVALLAIGSVIVLYHLYKLVMGLKNKSSYIWVNAIHVAFIGPLLLYVGFNKKDTPRFAYELMIMLGFAAGGYHLFSLVKQIDTHPEPKT